MPKYKVLRGCFCHNPGDVIDITDEDAKAVGINDYVEKYIDSPPADASVKANDIETKETDTETADNTDSSTTDAGTDEINYDDISYQDLKKMADEKGLEYKHNVSRVDLVELLKAGK